MRLTARSGILWHGVNRDLFAVGVPQKSSRTVFPTFHLGFTRGERQSMIRADPLVWPWFYDFYELPSMIMSCGKQVAYIVCQRSDRLRFWNGSEISGLFMFIRKILVLRPHQSRCQCFVWEATLPFSPISWKQAGRAPLPSSYPFFRGWWWGSCNP